MIIGKIYIENFGRLSNVTFDLKEGLNEIYRENGFGKTTLSVFIKAMLYGMPAARENLKMERKKYFPWQGGNFGGYIEFTTTDGQFRLTRFFGKTPESDSFELLDLKTNKIIEKQNWAIGEDIFGVGKETFEMTCFFPQNKFESMLNNQMSANVLGLDKLKYDIANVNLAIDKIKKKEGEIKKLKPTKDLPLRKKTELMHLKNQLKSQENQLKLIENEIEKLNTAKQNQTKEFEEEKQRLALKNQLLDTKEKIERENLKLSSDLNNAYLELEKINKTRQELLNSKPKQNRKSLNHVVIAVALIFFLTPVLLGCLNIIDIILGIGLGMGVIFITAIVYFILLRKQPQEDDNSLKIQELDKQLLLLNNKIAALRQALEVANQSLENYQYLNKENETFSKIQEELAFTTLQYERKKIEKEEREKEIETINEEIDSLTEEINGLETLEKEIAKKLEILSKTKEFLNLAFTNVSTRFVEPVNSAMKQILQNFSLKDRDFVVDTNFDIKQKTDTGIKELDYSSQGIKDILYFCMRVYLIDTIFKKEKPFIILDDTFVNFDDKNMIKAGDILNKLSKDYQIIYSYCHEGRQIN